MKKTKLVSSTFHNFTMSTEQSKAIYATEVVLKTPPHGSALCSQGIPNPNRANVELEKLSQSQNITSF